MWSLLFGNLGGTLFRLYNFRLYNFRLYNFRLYNGCHGFAIASTWMGASNFLGKTKP